MKVLIAGLYRQEEKKKEEAEISNYIYPVLLVGAG